VREHDEAVKGRLIDDYEHWLRAKLSRGWRTLPTDIAHARIGPHRQRGQR
jgi:hypothetical protein